MALGEDDAQFSVALGGSSTATGCVRMDLDPEAVIDNVAVTATLPEPSTYLGLLAGLCTIGGLRRLRA